MDTTPVNWPTRLAIVLPATVAMAVAAFLFWEGLRGQSLPGCGAGSGCEAVASSRWSRLGEIPVAGPGAALYLAIVIAALAAGRWRGSWPVLVALGLTAAGASLWFIGLQLFAIKRICPYCMVDHGCGLLTAAIIIVRAPRPWRWGRQVAPALAGLVVFISGQILIEPKTYAITSAPPPPVRPAFSAMVTNTPAGPLFMFDGGSRTIPLYKGNIRIDPSAHPIVGAPTARYFVLEVFDYTCKYCRLLHEQLVEAQRRYGEQLAIIPVVVPLAASCNPTITNTQPQHINACLYARDALAVWKADPAKFAGYHHWLSESADPPPLHIARARAEELVGAEKFQAALADPAVEVELAGGIRLYAYLGAGPIPKMVLTEVVVTGRPNTPEKLFEVLEKNLGIPVPPGGAAP